MVLMFNCQIEVVGGLSEYYIIWLQK